MVIIFLSKVVFGSESLIVFIMKVIVVFKGIFLVMKIWIMGIILVVFVYIGIVRMIVNGIVYYCFLFRYCLKKFFGI